jgi:hypothetical protein
LLPNILLLTFEKITKITMENIITLTGTKHLLSAFIGELIDNDYREVLYPSEQEQYLTVDLNTRLFDYSFSPQSAPIYHLPQDYNKALTLIKKKPLPKRFEDLKEISGYYVSSFSKVHEVKEYPIRSESQKNTFKTKEQARASLALAQLTHLRDIYRKGFKPNYTDTDQEKYSIEKNGYGLEINCYVTMHTFLCFQTKQTAETFLNTFRDLIEEASPLLFD